VATLPAQRPDATGVEAGPPTPPKQRRRGGRRAGATSGARYPRWYWPAFAAPGIIWLGVLFVLPLYVVIAIAFGTIDPLFRTPVPTWNPAWWDTTALRTLLEHIFGSDAYLAPAFVRTFAYVTVATALCLLVAYPVAYFVARYAGRRKVFYLLLLVAPFWISYMMRMLAWVNLLSTDGLLNRGLAGTGLIGGPVNWLDGRASTVVLGLTYGYVPYMALPLFAALDRIDPSLLEASRDLGASRARTFWRVTLPMSRPAILAGLVITALPMFGDYFTNDLLSGSPSTSMVGNLINDAVSTPGQAITGAVLVVLLMVILLIPMLWYVRATTRTDTEVGR
jgi:ABC-type spermidine/putrescine transport system permease subunit I